MDALDFLKKIESAGYEAYIVGGYVRDKLLGIASSDVDITTSAPPKVVARLFDVNQDDELGCVNIKSSTLNVDITTFRKEGKYIKHKPKKIVYIKDLITDLKRRDFTINTICMNSNGDIADPLNGKEDIDKRKIKVVGKVSKKFKEDPLRMLRAFRFSIVYNFKIADEELIFILNNKELFNNISFERRKEEIGKILISKNSIDGLKFLKSLGILEILGIDYNNELVYIPDYIGMWAQLKYSNKYPFSKLEKSRIQNIREIIKCGKIDKNIIFKYGLYDALVSAKILDIDSTKVNDMYKEMHIHSNDELKISGEKIKALLNIGDSPLIKEIKRDLICNLISGNLTNEEKNLEKYILEKWK